MQERIVISSYPKTVVIGNRCWRPGINHLSEADLEQVHWPSVHRDPRLAEKTVEDLQPVCCRQRPAQAPAC